ncbi:MAG TPA: 2-C-methyl-D-erythritol 4-phosphate cytidylyltransferase [Solirubrobacteraceae bacterium]|nr:2-C-methyl-D-erythritol 4-phosphate cytidylyltransferase [Solirubrobacteraceae bacterium]
MAVALIVAAGRGERLGAGAPKALAELAGRSLLARSVELMLACQSIDRVVVALPPGAELAAALESASSASAGGAAGVGGAPVAGGDAVAAGAQTRDAGSAVEGGALIAVEGGAVRSESVANALAAAGPGPDDEPVVVHDAARPLATPVLVQRTLDALARDPGLDGAIAAVPVADTVKRVRDGVVVETLDRAELWAVQTPQAFRRAALQRALDVPAEVIAKATDDAWLLERSGGRIAIVPSDSQNLKITDPLDLEWAEFLIARGHAE